MKKWEDIVKDRLEAYESELPEGSLAEFRSRRDLSGRKAGRKIRPVLWTATAALAAGLAALLILRQPSSSVDVLPSVPQTPVAEAVETTPVTIESVPETVETVEQVLPVTETFKATQDAVESTAEHVETVEIGEATVETSEAEDVQSTEGAVEIAQISQTSETESIMSESDDSDLRKETGEKSTDTVSAASHDSSGATTDISIADYKEPQRVGIKIAKTAGKVAGTVLGTGLTAGVLGVASGLSGGFMAASKDMNVGPAGVYTSDNPDSKNSLDDMDRLISASHEAPLRIGFSTRIPVAEKWSLTTGARYSIYRSTLEYAIAKERKQTVNYISIPLRLDRTLLSGKWFDIYAGAGAEVDFCRTAILGMANVYSTDYPGPGGSYTSTGTQNDDLLYFSQRTLDRDGAALSLIGSAGVQLNLGRHLGLYLEPEMSWTLPHDQVLDTYRAEHPFMFSVNSGMRFTFGK